MIITILQMRNLKLREMKGLTSHFPLCPMGISWDSPNFHVREQSKCSTYRIPKLITTLFFPFSEFCLQGIIGKITFRSPCPVTLSL